MSKTNLALVGSGYWGKNLARIFAALEALAAICDTSEPVLEHFQQLYPDVKTSLALSTVLADDSINSLAIATPAETHFVLAREALYAGKHVFVEKPLALSLDEAEELAALADEKGLVLMVGHLLQYHPAFLALLEMARSGALGKINYIQSNRLNLGKIRREENSLWSFAPHDISMLLALADEEPESVLAIGGNYLHEKIADVTTTHLKFPSGMRGHIHVSWLHPFKEQKLIVVGDKKMAVFDDTQPWDSKLLLYAHSIDWQQGAPTPTKAEPEAAPLDTGEPLKAECQHFLDCIAEKQAPRTDGYEGIRVLRVLKAAQKSLDMDSAPIQLSKLTSKDENRGYFAHPSAVLDEGVVVGAGSRIWHFSHILKGSHVGKHVNIGQNVVVGPDVYIGNRCKIQNNVSVYKGVTLEDEVFCGPSMVFTNVHNPRAHLNRMDEVRATHVGKGATLGANCTIVCGNNIGSYAFIGAGAVVTKSAPDHALMVGNPARRVGWVCACGERLSEDLVCDSCNERYEPIGDGLGILGQDA